MVLQGSVIGIFLFTTLQECQSKCLQNDSCKSINHQAAGKNICELNSLTSEEKENAEDMMVKRDGWNFLSTDYKNPTVSVISREKNVRELEKTRNF